MAPKKPINKKTKGSRAENKCRKQLRSEGWYVVKSAGSFGLFDLVAIKPEGIRLIQCKSGTCSSPLIEYKTLKAFKAPSNATIELWRYFDYARQPIIEVLNGRT